MKKVLYVDMDNVLTDFPAAIARLPRDVVAAYERKLDEVPGIFADMLPMPHAVESFLDLAERFDTYILSTAPWENPSAWTDKLHWVKRHLGEAGYKRLILTHHKNLNRGDFLVDDRTKNGAGEFAGEHILFGSEKFPDWPAVAGYLRDRDT